jgi:ABC-type transport system involved in cytochrome bd biosynthesis fused ATPase/permease subunit
MIMTKTMLVVGFLLYVLLWVLAANGDGELVAPLLIPAVLAVLVALGVALNRFMGIAPRKQHFNDPNDETDR